MPGRDLERSPREAPVQQLAKYAKGFDLAINPALTASTLVMPGSGVMGTCSRGRAHAWAFRAQSRGEVQRPQHSQGKAGTRRCPAPPQPPPCSKRGRCSADQPEGTRRRSKRRRRLPSGQPRDRMRRRAPGPSDRGIGPASRNVRWERVPLTGPAQGSWGASLAKRVVRQGFPCPTPPNAELNITAGTTVARRVCAPLRYGASARRATF